ncbi:MAG: isoprenylcysteine carboxylmethyltransferase family protein [Bacteroidetes bacterium]|nr:isoprenylcysteine carboxylmethyltransferase family protein [Bacteroidota bacterium]MBU1681065.1 isoprenylcysteine carboxylmethyltransferase family protein [Bacteroidota bacterium]MBU2508409.1 isoprenylcysteine carboxylmethyltransferase family protein [Bacteroidota bacterium]
MDPINILLAINLAASLSANATAAKKDIKQALIKAEFRPKTYLQKIPPNIAALILILQILAVFGIWTLSTQDFPVLGGFRIAGLAVFIIFSWIQVKAFKSLGKSYSQEIVILKEHKLITTGLYKFIRHPQYLAQILSDLGAAFALLGYAILPLVILLEIPLFILRAKKEEKLLLKYYGEEYVQYKNRSWFFIPFIA